MRKLLISLLILSYAGSIFANIPNIARSGAFLKSNKTAAPAAKTVKREIDPNTIFTADKK